MVIGNRSGYMKLKFMIRISGGHFSGAAKYAASLRSSDGCGFHIL